MPGLFLLLVTLRARTNSDVNRVSADHGSGSLFQSEDDLERFPVDPTHVRSETHELQGERCVLSATLGALKGNLELVNLFLNGYRLYPIFQFTYCWIKTYFKNWIVYIMLLQLDYLLLSWVTEEWLFFTIVKGFVEPLPEQRDVWRPGPPRTCRHRDSPGPSANESPEKL